MVPVKTLEVPQDILDTARLTIDDSKIEMAVYLYVLTPESWTGTIVRIESVRRGKQNGKATEIRTRVQSLGGAG